MGDESSIPVWIQLVIIGFGSPIVIKGADILYGILMSAKKSGKDEERMQKVEKSVSDIESKFERKNGSPRFVNIEECRLNRGNVRKEIERVEERIHARLDRFDDSMKEGFDNIGKRLERTENCLLNHRNNNQP